MSCTFWLYFSRVGRRENLDRDCCQIYIDWSLAKQVNGLAASVMEAVRVCEGGGGEREKETLHNPRHLAQALVISY